jgi:hypothetical protein
MSGEQAVHHRGEALRQARQNPLTFRMWRALLSAVEEVAMRQTQGLSTAERYRQSAARIRVVAELNHDEDVKRTLDGIAQECEMLAKSLEHAADGDGSQAVQQDRKIPTGRERSSPPQDPRRSGRPRAVSLRGPMTIGRYANRDEHIRTGANVFRNAWAGLTGGKEAMTSTSRMAIVAMIFACAASTSSTLFHL